MKPGDAVVLDDDRSGRIARMDADAIWVKRNGLERPFGPEPGEHPYRRDRVRAVYSVIDRADVRKVWAQMCDEARNAPA